MQSQICNERGKCARPSSRLKYSFTIAPPFAQLLWRNTLGTRYPTRSLANSNASRRGDLSRSVFSSYGILVSLRHTEARRITFEETLRFERIHEETYRNFGFEIVSIEPGNLLDRVAAIKGALAL